LTEAVRGAQDQIADFIRGQYAELERTRRDCS
jgi:hypothetical protein